MSDLSRGEFAVLTSDLCDRMEKLDRSERAWARLKIPAALVAIENKRVFGTAALDLDITTDLTPSVVGLLVGPEYRRRGIATELLKATEDLARKLGYRQLYVSTTVLRSLLDRLGWRAMHEVQFLNAEQGSVYVRDL